VARFADVDRPVKKASQCTYKTFGGVHDSVTGENGIVLRVNEVLWKSRTKVEARGGDWSSGLNSSTSTFTLRKEKGQCGLSRTSWNGSHEPSCRTTGCN
jgi:hypothetical protein